MSPFCVVFLLRVDNNKYQPGKFLMSCKEQVQSLFIIRDLFGCLLWIPFPLVTEFPLFSENHRLESAYQNHLIVKLVLVGVLIFQLTSLSS